MCTYIMYMWLDIVDSWLTLDICLSLSLSLSFPLLPPLSLSPSHTYNANIQHSLDDVVNLGAFSCLEDVLVQYAAVNKYGRSSRWSPSAEIDVYGGKGGREREDGRGREGGREKERERKRLRSLGTGKEGKVYLSTLFKINRGMASPWALIWQNWFIGVTKKMLNFVYSQDLALFKIKLSNKTLWRLVRWEPYSAIPWLRHWS